MRVVEPSEAAIREAGRVLREAGLVAMPTETVYGLAGDATNGRAVASIYAAKGRPSFNPLIVHVESLDQASRLGTFSEAALQLARAFWPGPLTLVVPRRGDSGIADLVTAGLDSVAIRMPNHPVALALMAAAGRPLAAPSANRSGRLSPTRAEDVAAEFGNEVAMVLDGGACPHGIESTVVDATGESLALLRPGAVTAEAIEAVTAKPLARGGQVSTRPNAPGQLESHYAPSARVRLNATTVAPDEALLAFGPHSARDQRSDAEPQPGWRSRGSGCQSVRTVTCSGCNWLENHRRDADPTWRPRRGDQRSATPRRGTEALKLSFGCRAGWANT